MLLGIQNRLLTDFQLLCVFRGAKRLIVTRLEQDVPNSFIEPLRFACIPFAKINEFLILAFLEGFLRRIVDKESGFCTAVLTVVVDETVVLVAVIVLVVMVFTLLLCVETQKGGLPVIRKSALKAKL